MAKKEINKQNMALKRVSQLEFIDFVLAKIKPAFKKGKIKDAEDLHGYLSKFMQQWNAKCTREGKAPAAIEQAAFDLQEHGWMLNFILSAEIRKCTYDELNAYYDATRMILDDEIDRVNKILADLKEEYKEIERYEEIG